MKGYASAHSGIAKDYVVEPYKFTKDFVDIIAYDVHAEVNKIFKISRVDAVSMLGDWIFGDRHEEQPIDSFRMSGSPVEHVRLKLTLRAKNLLTEEYPVTGLQVTLVNRNWFWEGDVNALEGVGRFVLGLPQDVSVEEGSRLKEWLVRKGSLVQKKFGK